MPDPLTVIAEPRRAQILQMVWDSERSAGAIAAEMPVTFGAVSQHLRVLLDAELVVVRVQGRERYYLANKAALGPMAAALEALWFGKLSELKRLAEAEQRALDGDSTKRGPSRDKSGRGGRGGLRPSRRSGAPKSNRRRSSE